MTGLHERFLIWLTGGARGELPRDAALHASACESCQRHAIAYDALLTIDPGASPLPPMPAVTDGGRAGLFQLEIPRQATVLAAVVLLAVTVGIGTGELLGGRAAVGDAPRPSPRGEGIQGGGGGPAVPSEAASPNGQASASQTSSPDPESSQEAAATPATVSGAPFSPGPVIPPGGPPPSPVPTLRPTPTVPPTTASPVPSPTVTPTAGASAEPTEPPQSEEPSPSEAPPIP